MKNALISTYDKTGISELAKFLVASGVHIYSTSGTFRALKENNITATKIEDYTQFPEMLGGRVKSLHPKIYAGILAQEDVAADINDLKGHDITTFDLVCVNLYPFEDFIKTSESDQWGADTFFHQAMEMVDIGGPSMIRAAAKNHKFTIVLTHHDQYQEFTSEFTSGNGKPSTSYRKKLAAQAFNLTASYDAMIDHFFSYALDIRDHSRLNLSLKQDQILRYGENPHQNASLYISAEATQKNWEQIHGKELSYNNLLDLESALSVAKDFQEPSCFIFKHTNPCGAAIHDDQLTSLEMAICSDPASCFGGVVLFNKPLLSKTAEKLKDIFFEIIIAPKFSEPSLKILKVKKNLRLLEYNSRYPQNKNLPKRRIFGGEDFFLIQDTNEKTWVKDNLKAVTTATPNENDFQELFFAWRLVKHIKSNAIVFSKSCQSLGIGAGQMSRIDAAKLAIQKAQSQKHDLAESYLASDAFFPFRDVVDIAVEEKVRAIVQPGGSIRDKESIKAANEAGVIMLFTRMRHFRH